MTAAALACDLGPSSVAERSFTSTVAVGGRRQLVVDSILPLAVFGARGPDELRIAVDVRLSAGSTTAAEAALAKWALGIDTTDPDALIVSAEAAEIGVIDGLLEIRAPLDMDLSAFSAAGARIANMRGTTAVQSLAGLVVEGAERALSAQVLGGDAEIDAVLRAGDFVEVRVDRGNLLLALPVPLDARIFAETGAGVESGHPQLPTRRANLPYDVLVGRGLATAVLRVGQGSVAIVPRRSN